MAFFLSCSFSHVDMSQDVRDILVCLEQYIAVLQHDMESLKEPNKASGSGAKPFERVVMNPVSVQDSDEVTPGQRRWS